MTTRDAFKDRERALEQAYFNAQDAKLLERLRAEACLDEVAVALKDKLQVDDAELLQAIEDLGVTTETGAAFLMAPLVQVAWIDGLVNDREREAVLDMAAGRGIEPGSPAHAQLVEWLEKRPPDHLFDTALKAINAGLSVLPPEERQAREERVAAACKDVALASGGIAGLFGLGGEISKEERQLLDTIATRIHEEED